jgi:hypothetical protein
VKNSTLNIVFLLLTAIVFAQKEDAIFEENERFLATKDSLSMKTAYDPLAPQRAAFYSAALPGLGQAYNKRYWKIPVIYAGMATGVYFYLQNDQDYDRFRNAYKRRLAGFTDDEFYGDNEEPNISNQRLIDAQKTAQKNKDISIIVSLAFYLLNIIDANVDAHLRQFNVSNDLSLKPALDFNPVNAQSNYGLSFTYRLK